MTEAVERESPTPQNPESVLDSETATARLRERGERVRRRELDAALGRLEAKGEGEVTPAERAILDRLSARITAALVERWATAVADGTDPETALELLAES